MTFFKEFGLQLIWEILTVANLVQVSGPSKKEESERKILNMLQQLCIEVAPCLRF